ncbi:GIY-YIG nuclease family protein [Soonwooa sp.]|uniref:GIY-YIG nuclease family protein n=1 Tax=Soonwooa sp. TaxID=1938592 RepID=UPI0028A8BA4D|nr:GIY-YIG nuclease family protein [Soonwooa sp.]
MNQFPKNVIENLKNYVYIYSDPITEKMFYVGKGKGNRVFDHLKDKKECEKVTYLNELLEKGLQPKIEILIHGF